MNYINILECLLMNISIGSIISQIIQNSWVLLTGFLLNFNIMLLLNSVSGLSVRKFMAICYWITVDNFSRSLRDQNMLDYWIKYFYAICYWITLENFSRSLCDRDLLDHATLTGLTHSILMDHIWEKPNTWNFCFM